MLLVAVRLADLSLDQSCWCILKRCQLHPGIIVVTITVTINDDNIKRIGACLHEPDSILLLLLCAHVNHRLV